VLSQLSYGPCHAVEFLVIVAAIRSGSVAKSPHGIGKEYWFHDKIWHGVHAVYSSSS